MEDLWGFDKNDLTHGKEELPNDILKEQGDILKNKTKGIICVRLNNRMFNAYNEEEYNFATEFNIVVPALDNYSYNLFIVYSRPEYDYPVSISVGSSIVEDIECFSPKYTCYDKESFVNSLREILSSEEINRQIKMLYTKGGIF